MCSSDLGSPKNCERWPNSLEKTLVHEKMPMSHSATYFVPSTLASSVLISTYMAYDERTSPTAMTKGNRRIWLCCFCFNFLGFAGMRRNGGKGESWHCVSETVAKDPSGD